MSGVPGYTADTLNTSTGKLSKNAKKRMNKQKRREEEEKVKIAEVLATKQCPNDGNSLKSAQTKQEIKLKGDSEFKPIQKDKQHSEVQPRKQEQNPKPSQLQQKNVQQHSGRQQQQISSNQKQYFSNQKGQHSKQMPPYHNSRNQQRQWNNNRDNYDRAKSYNHGEDYFQISKELVRILRHGKYKWIKMDSNGFCFVDDITHCRKFLDQFGKVDFEIIKEIVDSNDKKRFVLKQDETGKWKISAAQGHSLQVQSLDLKPLTDPKLHEVIHGTYTENWNLIKVNGLSRMNRIHIHFTTGFPDDKNVVSGMRKSCDIVIKIDMEKAMKDGLKFFMSSNDVILSTGDSEGRIHPKYFDMAMRIYPKFQKLDFEVPPDYPKIEKAAKLRKVSP